MVQENPTWAEERIAAELSVKLGILVSPRTMRAYWPQDSDPRGCRRTSSQHWRTFVRNHAKAIVAADFLVAVTAGFRVLYVFVVMEAGSRRILHCNVTVHPTAAWTLQQFREAIPSDHPYRFLIHHRDSIFSAEVDDDLGAFGLKVLPTPVQAPKANAYCERLMGTIRRECLDYVIPLSEMHLRKILREWVAHYNRGRPHASLGPGVPDSGGRPRPRRSTHRHELPADGRIRTQDVLGGLHHEYWLEEIAARGRIDFLRSTGGVNPMVSMMLPVSSTTNDQWLPREWDSNPGSPTKSIIQRREWRNKPSKILQRQSTPDSIGRLMDADFAGVINHSGVAAACSSSKLYVSRAEVVILDIRNATAPWSRGTKPE